MHRACHIDFEILDVLGTDATTSCLPDELIPLVYDLLRVTRWRDSVCLDGSVQSLDYRFIVIVG
jgi:hypothetical protein